MKEGSIVDSSKNMIEGQFAEITDISQAKKGYNILCGVGYSNLLTSSYTPVSIEIFDELLPVIILGSYIFYSVVSARIEIKNSSSYNLKLKYITTSNYQTIETETIIEAGETSTIYVAVTGTENANFVLGSPVVVEIAD